MARKSTGGWSPRWSKKKKIRRARRLPVHECLINESWRESRLAHILLSRRQPDGNILFAVYLVDTGCLGLKDTFCNADMPIVEYEEELVGGMKTLGNCVPCALELAHTIVYGGIDYATNLGFRPHDDFRLSRHVLEQKSALPFRDDVEFGEDGKPLYVAGPDDDVEFVLEQLRLNLGEDGFEYIVPAGALGLDEDELEELLGDEAPVVPGLLEGEGMSVDRVRAFAQAAQEFYEAAPWKELTGDDLIEIQNPDPCAGMAYAVVLGNSGPARGLGFYSEEDQFWDQQKVPLPGEGDAEEPGPLWVLSFEEHGGIYAEDLHLWKEHDLPLADADAYPLVEQVTEEGRTLRPDAGRTAFLEGLLRALAASSPEELDAGEWAKEVETFDGPVTYELALPLMTRESVGREVFQHGGLLDRRTMERTLAGIGELFGPDEAADDGVVDREALREAQELCYEAFECRGRRRRKLAREAIEISPHCADAYVLLAEMTSDAEERLELYRKGVEAGRAVLGERTFREDVGHFWGLQHTRPFMRALFGVGQCLEALDREEEAAEHYEELLRLNPNDNQGVRDCLLPLLIALDRDEDARELLAQYEEDIGAVWAYCCALLAFRESGDTKEARRLLQEAQETNPYVPEYLLGEAEPPPPSAYYSPGDRHEALFCAASTITAWRRTDGVLRWLRSARKTR